MKYHDLLNYRDELLRASRLANLAYAHQWLRDFSRRIERAGLSGEVTLRGPHAESGRRHAELIATDFSQSVVEEHFLPEEIAELHTVLASVHEANVILEAHFRLEEISRLYVPALRRVLEMAEVLPERRTSIFRNSQRDAA